MSRVAPELAARDVPAVVHTPRELAFINAMIRGEKSARLCAIEAGYSDGWAQHAAESLLAQGSIVQAIEEGRAAVRAVLVERTGIDLAEVVEILAKMARFDLADLYYPDGRCKPIHEIPAEARLCIEGVKTTELFAGRGEEREHIGAETEFKITKRTVTLDMLMRHLGGFEADNRQTIEPLAELLRELRSRGAGNSALPLVYDAD